MHIVYCIAGLYRPAGMERVITDKANWLVRHGEAVTILTTEQKDRPNAFELDPAVQCRDLGIGYEDNNGKSIWNKLAHYPAKQRRHRRLLRKILEELKPDITVSTFCNEVNLVPGIAVAGKIVLEVHFSRFKRLQYERKALWGWVDRIRSRADGKIAARYHRFVVLTEEDRQNWKEVEQISVIPNPIRYFPLQPAGLETKTVLAVGRLTRQKGFDILLRIWAQVTREMPDWQLLIAGDGEDRAELEAQASPTVRFLGQIEDVNRYYQSASLLAMSSRYEGLPMALLEIQAWGLPAVAFDCPCGPRDILTDGTNGRLVPPGDEAGFSAALLELMKDRDMRKRMGEEAFRRAGKWTMDNIMQQWLDLFKNI